MSTNFKLLARNCQLFFTFGSKLIQTFHKINCGGKFNARTLQQYIAFIEALQYVISKFTPKSCFFGIHLLYQSVYPISSISDIITISCNFLKRSLTIPIFSSYSLSGIRSSGPRVSNGYLETRQPGSCCI